MLTELCRVLTDLGRADQQLERTDESPAAPSNDQIVDTALGRRHLRWRDVAIPGHFFSYSSSVRHLPSGRCENILDLDRSESEGSSVPTKSVISAYPLQRACTALVLLLLASCAQLPPVAAVSIPPVMAGNARVWFYRVYDPTESKGRPYIYMNESIVGISEQGYAFYRDVPAGSYHITVDSYGRDLYQFQDVVLASGQQEYIKILSLRSWVQSQRNFSRDTFYVAIIPPQFAQVEISHYPFLGGG